MLPTTPPTLHRKFQYFDSKANSNKFWEVRGWGTGGALAVAIRFGREGDSGQVWPRDGGTATLSLGEIDAKINEKTRKGYAEVVLHQVAVVHDPVPAAGTTPAPTDPRIAQLMQWIFEEAGEAIKTYLATTVDALSVDQIKRGKELLEKGQRLGKSWQASKEGYGRIFDELLATVEAYYRAIPTVMERRMKPETVVARFCQDLDPATVGRAGYITQEERLQQLEAAVATFQAQRVAGVSQYSSLGIDVTRLSPGATLYADIIRHIDQTSIHGYKIRVADIFEVRIPDERTRFERDGRPIGNVRRLYHGTASRNVRHILRSGLTCPRTASNGRMFGDGIYLADQASKSTNYCSSNGRGVPHFLFLANAALGKMWVAPAANNTLKAAPDGHDSVWGKGNFTRGLINNEYIVYKDAQQSLTHLVTFERGSRY